MGKMGGLVKVMVGLKGGRAHLGPMRGLALGVLAITLLAILPPAGAANFGAHAGLADDVWADPYFRAGALLADVDHWLPPAEPRTDTLPFALGIAQRAWTGSRNAWRFATGWYEHLDQDARFAESVSRVLAAYPSYTDVDVRLGFDYWTLRKHPFPVTYDWTLGDAEVLGLIAGGLVATNASGVRDAVDQLLHSQDLNNPGLDLQIVAANTWGAVYPDRARDMEAEYDRFYGLVTAGYVAILPRIDLMLRTMAATVSRAAADPAALTPFLRTAIDLEAMRPAGWMPQEAAVMAAFRDALPAGGLPTWARLLLAERAERVADLLT